MNDGIVTRSLSWKELVQRSWGKEYTAPEVAYEFTRRKFNDRGESLSGDGLTVSGSLYADFYADDWA